MKEQPLLQATEDGSHTLKSALYDANYHSSHGAIQESQVVFIDAAFETKVTEGHTSLAILEIGFGTGLNAFMTYLAAQKSAISIQYVGIEKHPIAKDIAVQLNYPTCLNAETSTPVFLEMHSLPTINKVWALANNCNFELTVEIASFETLDAIQQFDIIYHDAFAPSIQPYLWQAPFLEQLYKALRPKGILSTYCAQGAFKRALKAVGFEVKGLPGPKGKREMTLARKTG